VPLAFKYSPLPPNIWDSTTPGLRKFDSDWLVKASLKNNAPLFKKNVLSSTSKIVNPLTSSYLSYNVTL